MTFKSLLGSAAAIALATFAVASVASAGDPAGSQTRTPAASTTPSQSSGQNTQGSMDTKASSTSSTEAGIALIDVNDPQNTLAKASVQDSQGNSIGAVQNVVIGSNGKPTEVNVEVGSFLGEGNKVVAFKAAKLKFQQDRNILVTTMTKDQIKALPKAKGT